MARSSNNGPTQAGRVAGQVTSQVVGAGPRLRRRHWIVTFDRAVLAGLALGLILYVMPFWREGRLRAAFWVTLVSTLLHVYTSHKRASVEESGGGS